LAEQHKREWLANYYPHLLDNFNIGPYAIDKQNHCKVGDILIDDSAMNISQWCAKGGVGILHVSAERSLKELNALLLSC
jgi:5'(3')-deoxyribonucleotidase